MKTVTLEGTQELMKQRDVAVILATGGMGLVRAAYSAGKPAYGVGPGNAPCYIERSADVQKAASDIITGKTFDNGVLCSSPNSVVVDEAVAEEARREFQAQGGYFLNQAEMDALAKVLVTPQRLPESGARRQVRDVHRRQGRDQGPRRYPRADRAADRRRPRLPALDRKAVPGAVLVRRAGLARGLRALHPDPALRRHGAHHVDSFAERRGHPRVRVEEAGVPHLRQHADDARVDRPDDGPGSGDDARVRRLGRQHHLRQHLAPASAQHQARWPTNSGPRSSPLASSRREPAPLTAGPARPRLGGTPLPKAPLASSLAGSRPRR